jgi:F-type H+-transporting ATPase subunit b
LTVFALLLEESAKAEPSVIWKWLNFAILAGVLGRLISKNLGPMLTSRAKGILDGLAAGTKAKEQADKRAAEVQAKLANLEGEVARLRAEAQKDREREAERLRAEGEREAARIRQHAEQEIESAGKQARLELQRAAAKKALELAEMKIRARMTPDTQSSLLGGFIERLRV